MRSRCFPHDFLELQWSLHGSIYRKWSGANSFLSILLPFNFIWVVLKISHSNLQASDSNMRHYHARIYGRMAEHHGICLRL